MYGTVAKIKVKPENREKLREVMNRQQIADVPGYVTDYVLWENDSDTGWLLAVFADRESYEKNADDPAQHERYLQYMELMDAEPEWHDGTIEQH
jgi:hypothetical protein